MLTKTNIQAKLGLNQTVSQNLLISYILQSIQINIIIWALWVALHNIYIHEYNLEVYDDDSYDGELDNQPVTLYNYYTYLHIQLVFTITRVMLNGKMACIQCNHQIIYAKDIRTAYIQYVQSTQISVEWTNVQ